MAVIIQSVRRVIQNYRANAIFVGNNIQINIFFFTFFNFLFKKKSFLLSINKK